MPGCHPERSEASQHDSSAAEVCDACFNVRMPRMRTQVPGTSPGGNTPAGGMGLFQMRQ